jgi:pimeloyl-ACP methyl ester carboxylesterase
LVIAKQSVRSAIASSINFECNGTTEGLRAGLAYYKAFPADAEYNRKQFNGKLQMPVLAIGGEHSFGKFQLQGMQQVAENICGLVIPDCGHFIPEEAPDALVPHMLSFFQE